MDDNQIPRYIYIIGWIGTCTACFMYISYIPQIWDNLHGHVTPPLQPAVACLNCILWVYYAIRIKDWPVMVANAPGILFGAIASLTAL